MRLAAWAAVFLGSSLIEIIFREYLGGSRWWIGVTQCALLTAAGVAALASKSFRPIGRFLLAVAALRLCWYVVAPKLTETQTVQGWLHAVDWGARLFIARLLTVIGAALMIFTLVGKGLNRRDAFLQVGNLAAPAQPIRWIGMRKPIRWTVFGPILLALFGIALPLFLYFSLQPNFAAGARVVHFLPWILATAALNAANEEFQFRCVLLAHLRNVVAPGEAILLTAVLFGIGHYYGQPSGPIGVVMAGIAGWIWGRSMIETRGFGWAFLIHMVQDIVIFCFLAMAATT
jgi:membrane protease YdiL (CAAX protease family)